MKKLLQFTTDDGSDFFVEVEDEPVSQAPAVRGGASDEGTRGVIQNASDSFAKTIKPLKEISNSIVNCVKEFASSPDQVQVELGLKFTAKAGIIITSLDSEANLKITFTWKNEKPKPTVVV
jgi:hypothetical protein